jgi:hypothetical protein
VLDLEMSGMLRFLDIDRWKDGISWSSTEGRLFREHVLFAWSMLRINPRWVRLAMCVSLPDEATLRHLGLKAEVDWWMVMQERCLYRRVRGTTGPITVRLRQTGGGCATLADPDRPEQGTAYTLRACVPECNLTFCNSGAERLNAWPWDINRWNNVRTLSDATERGLNMACRATKLSGVLLHEFMHMCDAFSKGASITRHVGGSEQGRSCNVAYRVEAFWTFLVQEMLVIAGLDLSGKVGCWSTSEIDDVRTPWENEPPE